MIKHSTKKSNQKKLRKPRKENQYSFPNLLRNKNLVARKNMSWAMDGTHLDITLNNQPKTKHYLLLIVDLHTNNIIQSKVFYSGTNHRNCTTNAVIKMLQNALRDNQINDTLMIHSDRGPQYTSKKFFEFITNHKYLLESHTAGAQPWENSVMERIIRSFKYPFKLLGVDLPSNVKTTRDLQHLVEKRRIKMNNEALYTKNQGLTVAETIKQYDKSNVVEPEILSAREGTLFPETEAAKAIKQYKKEVKISALSEPITALEILDKVQITGMTTQHLMDNQSVQIDGIHDKLDQVLTTIKPKKRQTNKVQFLRDPVPKSMLETILKAPKPKGTHELSWARFKVTVAILFFTGLRISEVAAVSEEMLLEIVENGSMTFYQPKVNKYRTIRFTSHGVNTIKQVFNKNKKIIFNYNKVLFPLSESNRNNIEKFTTVINKLLKTFNNNPKKKITSHSFRVGFVSTALQHTSAHKTQKLIGHADIRSTMKYSRYELDPKEEESFLNQMFEDNI